MKFILSLILTFTSLSLFAADGSSGCGPGWYFFKENSLVSSALRATTNGILFPSVTFGMTSGTSNCTKHKLVLKEKESIHFITENYLEVEADVTRGQGTYLSTLIQTIGCDPAVMPYFKEQAKKNYSELFDGSINPEESLKKTYMMILRDKQLVRACSLG